MSDEYILCDLHELFFYYQLQFLIKYHIVQNEYMMIQFYVTFEYIIRLYKNILSSQAAIFIWDIYDPIAQ